LVSGRWEQLAWTVALSRCYNMSIIPFITNKNVPLQHEIQHPQLEPHTSTKIETTRPTRRASNRPRQRTGTHSNNPFEPQTKTQTIETRRQVHTKTRPSNGHRIIKTRANFIFIKSKLRIELNIHNSSNIDYNKYVDYRVYCKHAIGSYQYDGMRLHDN